MPYTVLCLISEFQILDPDHISWYSIWYNVDIKNSQDLKLVQECLLDEVSSSERKPGKWLLLFCSSRQFSCMWRATTSFLSLLEAWTSTGSDSSDHYTHFHTSWLHVRQQSQALCSLFSCCFQMVCIFMWITGSHQPLEDHQENLLAVCTRGQTGRLFFMAHTSHAGVWHNCTRAVHRLAELVSEVKLSHS